MIHDILVWQETYFVKLFIYMICEYIYIYTCKYSYTSTYLYQPLWADSIRSKWQAASSWKCRREDDTWGLCRHAKLSSSAGWLSKDNGMFWISQCCNLTTLPISLSSNFPQKKHGNTHLLSMTATTNLGISSVHRFTRGLEWNSPMTALHRLRPSWDLNGAHPAKGQGLRPAGTSKSWNLCPISPNTNSYAESSLKHRDAGGVACCCFVKSQQLQSSILYQGSLVSILRFPLLLFHASQLIQKPASSRNDLLNLLNPFSGNPYSNHHFIIPTSLAAPHCPPCHAP